MKCALCKSRDANKRNTHYLTDAVIRSCLNIDGGNGREKGFSFNMSSNMPVVEYKFQRETPVVKLEELIGRSLNDEEIENAKTNLFSVDYMFCNECEKLFSEIETDFINDILPQLPKNNLNARKIEIHQTNLIRLFFYLQVWRSSVCDKKFSLSDASCEKLRLMILNHKTIEEGGLAEFPISVTYLQTNDNELEYTTNYVGFTNSTNPYIILMNYFLIQFYDTKASIKYKEFYGLNLESDFQMFINYLETKFVFGVFTDAERKEFLNEIRLDKVKAMMDFYSYLLETLWLQKFSVRPLNHTKQEYLKIIAGTDKFNPLQYSEANIAILTLSFLNSKADECNRIQR